jgi:membrane-bound lytic murein transglycosylase D
MHDCFRLGRLVYLVTVLFIAAVTFGCAATQSSTPTTTSSQTTSQAEKSAAIGQYQRPMHQGLGTTYYPPPGKIDFCGEPVPLERQEVLEQFDKEFTLVVYNHAQVYRWLKRKERYFPWIEERLRRLNLPEDLKYVAIAESEPPLNAREKRKAVEVQFDFERSPESALQYLGDFYRNFKSWPLVLAAYHCGEKCVMDESRAQGERDYYRMRLPQETERYVFRILAIKAVLSNPTQYGYDLSKGAGYP